jgi:glyoxylase-like metal-dependent hydrolase (beta-lactamase superfamily II)
VAGEGGGLIGASASPAAPLERLPRWANLVRAPNPGPMTLDGTNTWVLRAPGSADPDEGIVEVDPGPLDEGHLSAVAAQGRVTAVIATHGHPDHVEGLERFLALCPGAALVAGGFTTPAGLSVTVIPTPGHTADSVTLVAGYGDERAALTGDTILGRGTTVVAHPDGDLEQYLASLDRLEQLGSIPVLPGHGPALADCGAAARYYRRHRLARLDQVRSAVAGGARTADDVVAVVYADIDRRLWPAARLSVEAQLAYLAGHGGESTGGPARLDPA